MNKIRSKQPFSKERSLVILFSVLLAFLGTTILVQRFYNPVLVNASFDSEKVSAHFKPLKIKGTKIELESVNGDTAKLDSVVAIRIETGNNPDSLYLWQEGKRSAAMKISENRFCITVRSNAKMVAEFRKGLHL